MRDVHAVADTSRTAALAFVTGTGSGWGTCDLATWLAGPYRAATAHACALGPTIIPPFDALEEGTLERVLLSTRQRVLDVVTSRNGWAESGFAPRAVASTLVLAVRDGNGTVGYAPVHHARVSLFDRGASLFFADYLTRPRDYEHLVVCEYCEELSFHWTPSHRGCCQQATRIASEVVLRE